MADVYCYATTPPEADYKAKETWKCFKSIVAI
jgi:hypothetical protein